MKISSKVLLNFLNKVFVAGSINDAVLRFEPDGLHVSVKDITTTGAVNGVLYSSNFQDYVPMRATIKDTSRLMAALKNIPTSVSISVDKNVFKLTSEESDAELIMPDEQYLECNLKPEQEQKLFTDLRFDEGFEVDAAKLKVAKGNTQTLGTNSVLASINDGIFYIRSGEDSFDKFTVKIPVNYNNVSARYGTTLLGFMGVLDNTVNIAFNDNFPMLLRIKNAEFDIKWLASPIIVQEDENAPTS